MQANADEARHRVGYSIGEAHVDPASGEIRKNHGLRRIEPRLVAVLGCLVRRRGEVVTRQELLDQVWSGDSGGDESLTQAVSKLRKLLDDATASPRLIETIPKCGYRFIGDVEWDAQPGSVAAPVGPPTGRVARIGWKWTMIVGISALMIAALVTTWLASDPGHDIDPDMDIDIEDIDFDSSER